MKTTTCRLPGGNTALLRMAAITVGLALALSACGGGKTNSEPNFVSPGAPLATDIAQVSSGQTAPQAGAAPTPPPTPAPLPPPAPVNPVPATPSLKDQIQALERRGSLPVLDRSNSITGPDTNNNGVRDDIEAYINGLPLTAVQKRAVMQDARATRNTLTVDLQDKTALQKVGDGLMASTKCLGAVFASDSAARSDMSEKIEAMTANTKERTKRYLAYNAARAGSVTSWPSGDTCEK